MEVTAPGLEFGDKIRLMSVREVYAFHDLALSEHGGMPGHHKRKRKLLDFSGRPMEANRPPSVGSNHSQR
jgi:hypothetical protein